MSNLTVENVYLRQEAKQIAKKHRWTLIGMCAILLGVSYAISYGGTALLTLLGNSSTAAYWIGYAVLFLVSMLVSSGLMLGLSSAIIDLARDAHIVRVSDLFGRMSSCFKAFRLSLWVVLKSILWSLPAVAVTLVSAIILAATPDSDVSTTLLTILPLVMTIAMFALMLPAMYRYLLSTYILADAPETGVRECVNRSKVMMKGHKWQAFKLPIPFYLAMFGLMLAVSFVMTLIVAAVGGIAGAALATLLIYAGNFAILCIFMPRIYMSIALFYLKRADEQSPAADTTEAAPDAVTDEAAEITSDEE